MSEQELIELLADKEHASWARWMTYLFRVCRKLPDGSIIIPSQLVEHWQGQIDTPYSELTEREKESNRAEVAHILPIIKEYVQKDITLEELRPGAIFVTEDGIYAVKSEYTYSSDNPQCECVLLESGEYAHFHDGNRTRVREVTIVTT